MVLKTMDINNFLESSLLKILMNKQGEILGMTKAFQTLIDDDYTTTHASDIFDRNLMDQIETFLLQSIYQPSSEKAIITVKINEQKDKINSLYERTFQTATVPMALINEWGFFISVNEEFNRTFLHRSNGVYLHLKKFLADLRKDDDFSIAKIFEEARLTGSASVKMRYERNGETLYFNTKLLRDQQTGMYIVRLIDITEQEILLQRLAHSDQLSTTGEIAASIAHEVRNPMTTLQGFLQLLEHEVTGNAHKYVTVIQGEVQRMNEILNEMLTLSRPSVDEVTVFSLTVLVEDILVLLRPKALLDQINIVTEYNVHEPVLIKGNPNRMKQVFVNLLKNAMEAMEPNGKLTVLICEEKEGFIEIYITDTGCGMTEETMHSIFLPFVTKKMGGTGLGLPFVQKTVSEYGGIISVSSVAGEGTVFHVSLPTIDDI